MTITTIQDYGLEIYLSERRNYLRIKIIAIECISHRCRSDQFQCHITTCIGRLIFELNIRHDKFITIQNIFYRKISHEGNDSRSENDSQNKYDKSKKSAKNISDFRFIFYGNHSIEIDNEESYTKEGQKTKK